MNESKDVEQPCVDMANKAGWHNRKLDIGPGGKGWLDQLFLGPNGGHFIVEFKSPKGKKSEGRVSDKQHKRIGDLRRLGHDVYICDSVDRFESILMHHDNIARLKRRRLGVT